MFKHGSSGVVVLLLIGLMSALQGTAAPRKAAGSPDPLGKSGEQGQEQATSGAQLYPGATIGFPDLSFGAVAASVQCDVEGNVYLERADSLAVITALAHSGASLPITKLTLGSRSHTEFAAASPPDYGRLLRTAFYVTPRGRVYALVLAYHRPADAGTNDWPDSVIVAYKDDGSIDSVIKLRAPQAARTRAFRMAAFGDGRFLVSGILYSDDPRPKQTGPFTWVFDRGGGYVASLELPHDESAALTEPSGPGKALEPSPFEGSGPPVGDKAEKPSKPAWPLVQQIVQGPIVGALDGTIYILRASDPARLYVIDSGGRVLRSFDVRPPRSGLMPSQASLAGQSSLLVEFSHPPDRGDPHSRVVLAVVDPNTGAVGEVYGVPSSSGVPACAKSENEFLFLDENEKGQLEVRAFTPR